MKKKEIVLCLFITFVVHSIVQDLSNNDFECYSLADLLIRYRKVCRYINMLEEFSSDNTEQAASSSAAAPSSSSTSSNIDVNRMYIAQYHQYSLFHSLSKSVFSIRSSLTHHFFFYSN